MNKKVVKYCADTLSKMVDYHNSNDEELLGINFDLKRLLLINKINLYNISKYKHDSDKDFYVKLRDLLFERYIKTEIVRQWLELYITNSAIDFEEVLNAADFYNSKTLEINVKINKKIDLSKKRTDEIINFILVKTKNEIIYDDDYQYFIINIIDKKNKDRSKLRIFRKEYVDEIDSQGQGELGLSKTELLNTIFDYFIINKKKERT
ncbi:MAG: hypothetical protein V1779_13865 [bacterium]